MTTPSLPVPRRVLIVKMSSIGDVLHATPIARALREAFPNAYLAWAVDQRCAEVVQGNPWLDEIVVMRRPGGPLRQLWDYWRTTRALPPFDWTLDLHGIARSAVVTYASRAPFRVGFAGTREGSRFAYTHVVKPPNGTLHRVDYYAAFVEQLGIPVRQREMLLPRQPEHNAEARQLLREVANGTGPLVAMSLTAGRPQKCWPVEHFAALADRLIGEHHCRVVLVGSFSDRPVVETMKAQMRYTPADFAGRIGLKTLAALLNVVDLFVSADTGPMHIAASVKTPVVALFGPTDPALYGPYAVEHVVLRKPCRCAPKWRRAKCGATSCMRALSVSEVEQAAIRLLEKVGAMR